MGKVDPESEVSPHLAEQGRDRGLPGAAFKCGFCHSSTFTRSLLPPNDPPSTGGREESVILDAWDNSRRN